MLEIDDVQDLDIAESIFTPSPEEKLVKIQKRYGGYWLYPLLLDFCYLVNPYYPPAKLMDEIKANFERLICEYPSGIEVNNLLAAKYFGLDKDQIVVGNGASELIKAVTSILNGKFGLVLPTFEEYPNRLADQDLVPYYPDNRNYSYTAEDLMAYYQHRDISNLLLINPDNPSGNYINKREVLQLIEWAKNKGITCIVDESFVDFADTEEPGTLLEEDILTKYQNLMVVKSISKSFGVPGLRLGVLASGNLEKIHQLKKDVAIWNINSFAEFYLNL